LSSVLSIYVQVRGLGVVITPPFQMKLTRSGREPDLMFVAREHLGRLRDTYLDGPADMVVEIVSPESVRRDRVEKYYEYQVDGVEEYWLIDPRRERAEFYRLGEEGRYEEVFAGREGVYRSKVIAGLWFRGEWRCRKRCPPAAEVLLEMGGRINARHLIERLKEQGWL